MKYFPNTEDRTKITWIKIMFGVFLNFGIFKY